MAAYPDVGYDPNNSGFTPLSGRETDRATDGTVRIRSFYSETQYEISLFHPYCTETERDTLMTFWDTNKDIANTLTRGSDSSTFTVYLLDRPTDEYTPGGYWNVTVRMVGTKD